MATGVYPVAHCFGWSAHVAGMAERIPAGLRPDAEPVWLDTDRDAVRQRAGCRVEHIDLAVVATTHPELFPVGGHIAHVGAAAVRNRPRGDDFARDRID